MNELIAKTACSQPSPGGNCPGAPRILFADDDPAICRYVARALAQAGYAVTTVVDGQEAWEALKTATFDLLVTDNQMPHLSGQELVVKVRQHGLELPIIVMSSELDFFLDRDNEWLQVAQLLRKPVGLRELTAAVERALHAAR